MRYPRLRISLKIAILLFLLPAIYSRCSDNAKKIEDAVEQIEIDAVEIFDSLEAEEQENEIQETSEDLTEDVWDAEAPEETQADIQDETVQEGLPFSKGPYGSAPFGIAGKFSVPTADGEWDFEGNWGWGKESYVFVVFKKGNQYSDHLWNSSFKDLFKYSPANAHFFFLSYDSGADETAKEIGKKIDLALEELGAPAKETWKGKIHAVTVQPQTLENWLGDVVKKYGYISFAIDRFQRLREVGLLALPAGSGGAELKWLQYEVKHFNFEAEREEKLAEDKDVKIIQIFKDELFSGNAYKETELPNAAEMSGFDTMEIDLAMGCEDKTDTKCGDWDYIANLFLCDAGDPEKCDTEIARWITAYHRQGRWVTDITPALAFIKDGGKRRFRYDASGQAYLIEMKLRLSNQGKGVKPFQAQFLWGGGAFNLDYNPGKQPVKFSAPEGTKKAEIFALITGHGFGWDKANCAEFCNHTHHFNVNGKEFRKEHPLAGTMFGCAYDVDKGVVPNQFGTWIFGRGGWCPGFDVKPFVADVTKELVSGENTITYKALFMGKDYDPVPIENPQGFPAEIRMSSYLVFYK